MEEENISKFYAPSSCKRKYAKTALFTVLCIVCHEILIKNVDSVQNLWKRKRTNPKHTTHFAYNLIVLERTFNPFDHIIEPAQSWGHPDSRDSARLAGRRIALPGSSHNCSMRNFFFAECSCNFRKWFCALCNIKTQEGSETKYLIENLCYYEH